MEGSVKFSVLVPVYKVEKYIDECIGSVLNQTYQNFELILVDDGSPDRSGQICEEYAAKDGRIKVFHKENGGQLHTRRYAIERAVGDYMVFLDSDDYLAPDSLEILEENIRNSGADCLIYGIEWLKPTGTEHIRCNAAYCGRLISDKAEVLNIVLNDSAYNSICRKCVKRSCFDMRDYSACFHIRSGEDKIHSFEILENAESFLFLPDQLYFYRVNTGSVTHNINFDSYKADFTADMITLESARKIGVLTEADFNRMRNFALDNLVVTLKRLTRFCSERKYSIAGFEKIQSSVYYRDFLSRGYRKAPAIAGVKERLGLRRFLNRMVTFLFRLRCYSLVIFINKYIYK